jgi:flagellar basal body L-ring protein FlgH
MNPFKTPPTLTFTVSRSRNANTGNIKDYKKSTGSTNTHRLMVSSLFSKREGVKGDKSYHFKGSLTVQGGKSR